MTNSLPKLRHIKRRHNKLLLLLFSLFYVTSAICVKATEIKVAVASNFHSTLIALVKVYELSDGENKVVIVPGSTGKLYAQIRHGAPYDIFMAADKERPRLLERDSIGVAGSRFTYANGRLALWSPDVNRVNSGGKVLKNDDIQRIAVANPKLAPYGKAALEYIEEGGFSEIKKKLVYGENISQVYHLVASGSAELGLVALSQLKNTHRPVAGSYWVIPAKWHQPIEQQAIILKKSDAANAFISYLKSEQGQNVIKSFGYLVAPQQQDKGVK